MTALQRVATVACWLTFACAPAAIAEEPVAAALDLDAVSARMAERIAATGPWEARLVVDIALPGLKVRGKKVELEFTPPGTAEFKAKGFVLLPKRTLLLSPDSLFLGLSDPVLDWPRDSLGASSLRIRGAFREDGLLAKQEYRVDTLRWLLTNMSTSVDSLPALSMTNTWQEAAPGRWLPLETLVEMQISEKLRGFYERLKQPMRRRKSTEEGPGRILVRYDRVELKD